MDDWTQRRFQLCLEACRMLDRAHPVLPVCRATIPSSSADMPSVGTRVVNAEPRHAGHVQQLPPHSTHYHQEARTLMGARTQVGFSFGSPPHHHQSAATPQQRLQATSCSSTSEGGASVPSLWHQHQRLPDYQLIPLQPLNPPASKPLNSINGLSQTTPVLKPVPGHDTSLPQQRPLTGAVSGSSSATLTAKVLRREDSRTQPNGPDLGSLPALPAAPGPPSSAVPSTSIQRVAPLTTIPTGLRGQVLPVETLASHVLEAQLDGLRKHTGPLAMLLQSDVPTPAATKVQSQSQRGTQTSPCLSFSASVEQYRHLLKAEQQSRGIVINCGHPRKCNTLFARRRRQLTGLARAMEPRE